ncbi:MULTISPECIES: electron transfer flavoprotein subunit beta/FixA family protein [unclassified Porphyromonas]|uniref:electron transfer flavoprotein subunit beta/FixA family protein n=1 Tax=unclassified Porphyromonas TaxID=2645799 RepID=UPI00052D2A19|nr:MULTISPECIES: electron transfer flavoprotein subunit beta/FixA family protein [unclassified Porphyromonas]KGN86703.1 electron transfer flavoprotein subunit beta [Porphyromonas sp. COT-290 OH860]KGO01407.1 electron transfer flavoprotein subunit beta [Porphyromonas sp. COT-290 OH3588]
MKIVVCIKQVPDTTEIKIDPVKGTLIRDGVPSIMNPDDKGGLEQALRFKDEFGAHVTVITMGPPQAEAILREAFAMGVDEAILLSDRKFGGSDSLATSYTLAAALRNLEFDLLITGRQAIDGDTAQVGPQIAEHLGLPQVTYVADAKKIGERTLEVRKETETGYEILEVDMPCVLTILASGYEPRYMNVRGIMETFDRPITLWSSEDITVDEQFIGLKGSPTRVGKSFTKGAKAKGVLYEDLTAEEAADVILEKLKEKFII